MFTENFIMTQMADVEQRTKMANSLKKVLEETFRDSLIFPKGEVPCHSFTIKGFYPEEMIASGKVLFDELSVAYVQKGRLETCPLLKGWITSQGTSIKPSLATVNGLRRFPGRSYRKCDDFLSLSKRI